jgi:DTW domain-containing protein YfiP
VSRRHNTAVRCSRCRLHRELCICGAISPIDTRTRVIVVLHKSEDRKSTNTGRIAALCLRNSEVVVRGHRARPIAPLGWDSHAQPLLLFPHPTAVPLARFAASERPLTLVVPDGTWRQASKVRFRMPGICDAPCVSLPAGAPSTYRLRAPLHDGCLSTMEAIARALGILEGPAVEQALDLVFRMMVERTLWSRGSIAAADVTGGIPDVLHTADA